ncbi:MAG: PHB depolymerase family esterase [Pseudomonadota bacterium]
MVISLVSACGGDGPKEPVSETDTTVVADTVEVTLSGLSSGGYMAVQTHLALGEQVGGVAVIAGGPYHCAQGSIGRALGACLTGEGIDLPALHAFAEEAAGSGEIAPLSSLAEDRVWLFQSPADGVVQPAVGRALEGFYARYVGESGVAMVDDVPSAHGWPTLSTGNACDQIGGAYLNACGYDGAGAALAHLYGPLVARAEDADAAGALSEVEIADWLPPGSSLAPAAFAYVPDDCADAAAGCRLHISFHGCQQGADAIGEQFAAGAGLNEWAGPNRIVVLYPQVSPSLTNPLGCWDWWGYTGGDYDVREGKQVLAVARLIEAYAKGQLLTSLE